MKFHHWSPVKKASCKNLHVLAKASKLQNQERKNPSFRNGETKRGSCLFYVYGRQMSLVFVTPGFPMERNRSLQELIHLIYLRPNFRMGLGLK